MTEEAFSEFWGSDEDEILRLSAENRRLFAREELYKDALTRIREQVQTGVKEKKNAATRLAYIQRIISELNADIKRVSH